MKATRLKKPLALLCAAILLLTAAAALAQTVEPERSALPEALGGLTFSATLKTFDEELQCFPAVLYERDCYGEEAIASLQIGDTLVFCDAGHTVSAIGQSDFGILELQFEDGEDILLDAQQNGGFVAMKAEDDMICMHTVEERNLKAAADIVLIDFSNLELEEPVTVTGLEAILALQAQREAESIGFDCTVTMIILNDAEEICEIRIFYAPWQ